MQFRRCRSFFRNDSTYTEKCADNGREMIITFCSALESHHVPSFLVAELLFPVDR